MLPDEPFDQARLFYLVLLATVVGVGLFPLYRGRLGQAAQHAAIWVLIFLVAVLVVGFSGDLKRFLTDPPEQISADTVALNRQGDGHFHALVEVNGQPIRFIVDTGATNLVLSKRDAKAAGLDTANLRYTIPTMTANGQILSAPVRLEQVRLAEFIDYDVGATVNGGDLNTSLLGMRYLDRFTSMRVEGDRMYLSR